MPRTDETIHAQERSTLVCTGQMLDSQPDVDDSSSGSALCSCNITMFRERLRLPYLT